MTADIIVQNAGQFPTKEKRVLESLTNLISTKAGAQAGNREFGIDQSCLDKPIKTAEALLIQEIYIKTKKFESRAEVKSVKCQRDGMSGKISIRMVIEIVED